MPFFFQGVFLFIAEELQLRFIPINSFALRGIPSERSPVQNTLSMAIRVTQDIGGC